MGQRRSAIAAVLLGLFVAACSNASSKVQDATTSAAPLTTAPAAVAAAADSTVAFAGGTQAGATTVASSTAPPTSRPSTSLPPSSTTGMPPATTKAPRPVPAAVTVSKPTAAGKGQANATSVDLKSAGFVEEEFFVEGDATQFRLDGQAGGDGRWNAAANGSAHFRTRLVVRRPLDVTHFSGVVLVEWLNVTAGNDGDPDWGYNYQEILRQGDAYVGVSAQAVGVSGGAAVLSGATADGGLVKNDPARYGSLVHPGDPYSFDIFTKAANSLIAHDGPAPLGDLHPRTIIAMGESQSATYLTTYVNAVQPVSETFDGFLLHSRLGTAPGLDGKGIGLDSRPFVRIRTDTAVPVMIFETETDLTVLRYFEARQDDTDSIRTWEVAGTAHADRYLLTEVYKLGAGVDAAQVLGCTAALNDGTNHQTVKAALHHLVEWVQNGTLPPVSPRLDVHAGATDADPAIISRDARGNALGGIRTPSVDVPVSALSGDPVKGAKQFCVLFGSTAPFDAATLAALYPTHDTYVQAFTASAEAAVNNGFVLRPEADTMIAVAIASTIGR
jgi:Alpha/beta hydrolase domain